MVSKWILGGFASAGVSADCLGWPASCGAGVPVAAVGWLCREPPCGWSGPCPRCVGGS